MAWQQGPCSLLDKERHNRDDHYCLICMGRRMEEQRFRGDPSRLETFCDHGLQSVLNVYLLSWSGSAMHLRSEEDYAPFRQHLLPACRSLRPRLFPFSSLDFSRHHHVWWTGHSCQVKTSIQIRYLTEQLFFYKEAADSTEARIFRLLAGIAKKIRHRLLEGLREHNDEP